MRRITLAELAFGCVLTLGVLSALWVLIVSVEASFWLGTTARSVLSYGLLAAALGLVLRFLARPLLRLTGMLEGPSEKTVARRIGRHYPEVSDRLLNLLDLADGRRSAAPNSLIDRAVRMLAGDVDSVSFEQVENFQAARRAGRFALVPVLGLSLFLAAAPTTFLDASYRLLSPNEHFAQPAPFQLTVTPGPVDVVKGDSLEITVQARGNALPQQVTLALRNEDEEHVNRVQLTAGETTRFHHTLVNVRKPLRYRVESNPVTTQWYPVTLTERPLLRTLQVTLDFPDYTGIPSQHLDPNVGDVKALPGTDVRVEAETGSNTASAYLRFQDGRRDTLSLQQATASGSFTLQSEGSYQILLKDERGVTNRAPISYSLQLLSDASPSIALVEPDAAATLDKSLQSPLRMRISDDFGFAALRLYYRLAESRHGKPQDAFQRIDLPLENPGQLSQEVIYNWLLSKTTALDPVPGDVIEYYVRVWDNDAVAGYKSARTSTHELRLPSLEEQYEEVDQEQGQAESEVDSALQEAESLEQQFRQLRDELRRKNDADWEDKRQLEQLRERQQEIEKQVDEATRRLEELTRKMEQNKLVDEETLDLYKELQRVMDEVNSPELQEAMQKLQEAMQNMNRKQMQEALQNVELNEQQYQQRLKRALELFKKAQVQQQLQEVARRTEELARQQEQLARQTKQQHDREGEAAKRREARQAQKEEASRSGEKQENDSSPAEEEDRRQNPTGQPPDAEEKQGSQPADARRPDEASQQKEAGSPSKEKTPEELAQDQQEASKSMQELEHKVDELRKKMQGMRSAPKEQMQQMQKQLKEQQMPQQMQENSRQLRQKQFQKARQGQQQMQKQLQRMQQQMQQMQQNMKGRQMKMNMAGLRQTLSDILTLSQQQEGLRAAVRGASSNGPQLRDYAQRQQKLSEGLNSVADSLQQLARNIPQMRREVQKEAGQAQQEMRTAVDQLTERQAGRAGGHQKSSMMHLNELGLLLSDLLNQMQSSSGGSGNMSMQQMQQQLQQMAGQQQGLNKKLQQFLNKIQGNRLSIDQQKRLDQMARQQQAIQRELKKLSRNRGVKGKALGNLQKVAEQMEETIEEMRRRNIDPKTIERQRQIHSRLLDAQRSLREQGKSKKRKSNEGRDLQRESPDEVVPAEEAEQLRRALIRALENGYAPDYEELIKRYFKLLQQQNE